MASLSLADLMKRNGEFEAKPRAAPLLRLPAELAPKARRTLALSIRSRLTALAAAFQALRLAETVVAYQLSKADDEALQKLLRDVIKRPELRVRPAQLPGRACKRVLPAPCARDTQRSGPRQAASHSAGANAGRFAGRAVRVAHQTDERNED